MTAELPHERQPEPLEVSLGHAVDPALNGMFGDIRDAEVSLRSKESLDWKVINESLTTVNELWDNTEYPGTLGTFTGKIRESYEGSTERMSIRAVLDSLQQGEDEHGQFWIANGLELVCSHFTIITGEENELKIAPKIGLTLIAPEDFDDEDMAEGELMMFPDEIEIATFSRPAVSTIEAELATHFPELYRKVADTLASGTEPSAQMITRFIKNYYVPADDSLYHGYPIADRLAKFVTDKLAFDDELYEISVQGPQFSVDENEDTIESEANRTHHYSMKALICGIQMMHDSKSHDMPVYRPHLLLAVPETEKRGGYYACVVPPETLIGLRSLRSKQTQFGEHVLMVFDTISELKSFFDEPAIQTTSEKPVSGNTDSIKTLSDFTEMTRLMDIPDILSYDAEKGAYVLSLKRDMKQVLVTFSTMLANRGISTLDADESSIDIGSLNSEMSAVFGKLQDFAVGDTIYTQDDHILLDITVDGRYEPVALTNGDTLEAVFQGFEVSQTPLCALDDAGAISRMPHTTELSVSVKLSNVVIRDKHGKVQQWQAANDDTRIVLTHASSNNFIKYEQTN